MITVYLTINGTSLGNFDSLDDAVAAARKSGFEAQIWENRKMIAMWSPISGVRHILDFAW